jgi:hypothetical protein
MAIPEPTKFEIETEEALAGSRKSTATFAPNVPREPSRAPLRGAEVTCGLNG